MSQWCFTRSRVGGFDVCNVIYTTCTSRGCPWWLYICSQLGFTRFLAFYSKSACWALRASYISFEWTSSLTDSRYAKHEDPMGHVLVTTSFSYLLYIQVMPPLILYELTHSTYTTNATIDFTTRMIFWWHYIIIGQYHVCITSGM
jgi:hypothetical protein